MMIVKQSLVGRGMLYNDKLKKTEITAIKTKNTDNFYLSGLDHYKEADQRSWQNLACKKVSMR